MVKLVLKNLAVSFLLILFMIAILGMKLGVMGELLSMPFTWRFIGIATISLTVCLAICDYKEVR